MQSFVLDRHTDPSNPELKISQDDKIPVYDTVADAEAAIANLADGQLISTKDEREIINAGSARPVTILQSSSINTIQFDTRFVIDAVSAITVTLGSALYAGCTVTIINATAIRHSLAGTFLNNRIPLVMANCIITLVWTGAAWQMLSYQDNGDSTDETFTGRFSIDNKPIYRRSYVCTTAITIADEWYIVAGWSNFASDYGINDIYITKVDFGNANNIPVLLQRSDLWGKFFGSPTYQINVGDVLTLEFTKTTD